MATPKSDEAFAPMAGIQAKHDYFRMVGGVDHSHTIQAPSPTPDQGGYYPTIQEAMKRALAAKRAGIRPTAIVDEDDEPEIQVVTVKYVICMTCGAGMTKEAFYFEGAKMNHCHCKLGEERWEIVSKPQRVGERPKTVIAPAPR